MNLLSLLSGLTKRDPHAIIAIDADPVQPVHVSRSELWRRTLQLRADLATAGVGRGDVVAVCLPSWSDLLGWQLATASLGACAVGLDPECPTDDLVDTVADARPRVLALDVGVRPEVLDKLRAAITAHGGDADTAEPLAPAVAVVPGPHAEPPVDPSPWDLGGGAWQPSAATAGMPMPAAGGDEPAVAFAPGLAAYRESTLLAHATATAEALGLGDGDLVVCTRPAAQPLAWSFTLAAAAGGATYLFDPQLDETALPAQLARFSATHLVADEAAARHLAAAHTDPAAALPTLRWVGIPNAESAEAAQSLEAAGVAARGFYAPRGILAPFALWPDDRSTADRWLGGGTPVCPDVELRITEPDAGTVPDTAAPDPAAAKHGVLEIRGGCVPDNTTGWFRTGDLASLTSDGDIRYEGPAPQHR
ncbi:hypothetical protein BJF85_03055 [Saccharomonospora sp. CUA-673]|uniref:AMP-binding protein n=1 Tax=Saccharomonospora sp. CUA-673 TaxID=1904969 RepID=UPI000962E5DF|nr:AMP-binding protein [Saccharomonospora sp. CUA-673]OLT43078.1 hypothetical protein BJF85_03055 [Saccharomonospora sp. CUA-673]